MNIITSRVLGTGLLFAAVLLPEAAHGAIITSGPYTACSNGEACGTPFNFIEISGTGTRIFGGPGQPTLDGNFISTGVAVNLPMDFQFYGQAYSTMSINPAGLIQFAQPFVPYHCCIGGGIPRSGPNGIYLFYQEWINFPGTSGNPGGWYQYFSGGAGAFADPTMVVEFNGRNLGSLTFISAEAALDLRTGQILLQFFGGDVSNNAGDAALIGIQNGPGAGQFLQWASGPVRTAVPYPSNVLITPSGPGPAATPEPRPALMLGLGLASLTFLARRKNNRVNPATGPVCSGPGNPLAGA